MRIKCEQCSATAESEDGETPKGWTSLGSAYGSPREEITVSCGPLGHHSDAIAVGVPRGLNFCTRRHAAEWLNTAIENHIHRCAEEDHDDAHNDA